MVSLAVQYWSLDYAVSIPAWQIHFAIAGMVDKEPMVKAHTLWVSVANEPLTVHWDDFVEPLNLHLR